ncbi:AraC family transcriptional regulator [Aquiflexum lacus]|uniref:AraC family transcriptional regulator n=1 Tax=Aquiflexum lacus TaxID=2483805 RepID=UPI001893BAC2|nr:AraC family transcriptional regulator [Aquiflexum lacus]
MKPKLELIPDLSLQKSFQFLKLETEGFPHQWHYHPEVELTYIIQGRGIRYVGDNISSFKEGDLVLLGENLPHSWVSQGEQVGKIQKALVFQFPILLTNFFPELRNLSEFMNQAKNGFHFPSPDNGLVKRMMEFEFLTSNRQLYLLFEILEILAISEKVRLSNIEIQTQNTISKELGRMEQVKKFLHEHYHEHLELDTMAMMMHMTPTYFCSWCKRTMGHTFITYLNKLRIEHAARWLIGTDKDVSEIAYEVGFQNVTHFNRVFKKEKKTNPQSFRAIFKNRN